jgi:SAM-dependent methyltransferase
MPLEPWETAARGAFRLRFDDDADAYDRTRPVAPEAVFDDVVRLAGLRPGSSVLEIGPGTGQATRALARRQLRVLALEIGAHLAERTRQNLAGFPDVTVLRTSFESWDPGEQTFDAVFACNSFHWIDPDVRFAKTASVLRRGGHLAVLSTPVVVPEDADRFWWDVQDDWAAVGVDREDPATKRPDLVGGYTSAIDAGGLFTELVVVRREFDVSFTAREYATNLSTQSGVKELPADAQAQLLALVQRRVEAQGGTLTVQHLAELLVAQRAPS